MIPFLPTFRRAFACCAVALAASPLAGQTADLAASATGSAAGAPMSREEIIAAGEKMADAQLAQLPGKGADIDWRAGVMWAGLADLSHVSSQPAYADALEKMGEKARWTPPLNAGFPNYADDLCICQTFLDAYATKNDPARLAPTRSRLDAVCLGIDQGGGDGDPLAPKGSRLIWWWCDSLFMAPASHARLSVLTRDPKYLAAMDKEYWKTVQLLYDWDEHLFFRDQTFIGPLTKNGKKIFWARGNGWVFAGLARTLPYIPPDDPYRGRYVTLFKDMAAKLASVQQTDGTWRPSLLDPDEFPDSETSGTSLNCYALAWGINNGLLDRKTYLPVAARAWAALLAARLPNGLLGYVQGVAAAPGVVKANGTQVYATGAFLMSACELAKLAPITVPPPPQLTPSSGK